MNIEDIKRCTRCEKTLPITEFYVKKRRPGQPSGYYSKCKSCAQEVNKQRGYESRRGPRGQPKLNTDVSDPSLVEKICAGCGVSKPLTQFHPCCKAPTRKWHWHSRCIPCSSSLSNNKRSKGYHRPSALQLEHRLYVSKSRSVKDGKFRAKGQRKELIFSITVRDVREIIARQSVSGVLRCAATGIELVDEKHQPLYPSIDRIDPERGYEPDNIRLVSRLYNLARNRWSDEQTINTIQSMVHSLEPVAARAEAFGVGIPIEPYKNPPQASC